MRNTKQFHNQLRSQLGMSLVELLVATAVLGIVIGTATTYFFNMNKSFNTETLKDLQVKIAKDIELALSNPDSIKNSSEFSGNTALLNCIAPGRTCTVTEPPGSNFTLIDSEAVPNPISGTTFGFDLNGGRCMIGTPKCVFSAQVKFWATCSLDAANRPSASCQKPGFLNFKYEVRVDNSNYSSLIPTYPEPLSAARGFLNADLRYVVRMRVTDVLVRVGDSCPAGQALLGFDQQGLAMCECMVQLTRADSRGSLVPLFDAFGRKICGDQRCPVNTLMTGYEQKTQTVRGKTYTTAVPRCRSEASCSVASPPADCPCKIINLNTVGDCGPGFWMVSITHGVCKAVTTKNGKGAPETVECSDRTGRCCSFEQQ